jgi:hypothetical protein
VPVPNRGEPRIRPCVQGGESPTSRGLYRGYGGGWQDNGAPGLLPAGLRSFRHWSDGHNIEAVCHGPNTTARIPFSIPKDVTHHSPNNTLAFVRRRHYCRSLNGSKSSEIRSHEASARLPLEAMVTIVLSDWRCRFVVGRVRAIFTTRGNEKKRETINRILWTAAYFRAPHCASLGEPFHSP